MEQEHWIHLTEISSSFVENICSSSVVDYFFLLIGVAVIALGIC